MTIPNAFVITEGIKKKVVFEYLNSTKRCQRIQNESLTILDKYTSSSVKVDMWQGVCIILASSVLDFFVAFVFTFIRNKVYNDANSLDTSFDAGGKNNAGIVATTVVSHWTWAASLLQSCTVTAKYGISGSIFYSVGGSIQVLMFAMLSVQLKIRAPGAKTFLQVIKARFGKWIHILFCIFALATNMTVTAMLMLAGGAVITSLVHNMCIEYAITLITAIIGGLTFIGGIGATFYVSLVNTGIICVVMIVFIFNVYGEGSDRFKSVGSISNIYEYVSCAKGPDGNEGNSYFTIISSEGLMFGLIAVVGNFGGIIVDQSYWQISVSAKPTQGVVGYIVGGFAWFAIPLTMSTSMGLAYIALSSEQGASILHPSEIDAGLVTSSVACRLLGKQGAMLILLIVIMAILSTGSAEVMAVVSIIIYDIYGSYLKPYRRTNDTNSCILCGRGRGRWATSRDKCECASPKHCDCCVADDINREMCRRALKPEYICQTHGDYRTYHDYLRCLKSWAVVWVSMCIIPMTLILYIIGINLGYVYLFMGLLIGPAVFPITLCMCWERLTAKAMAAGVIGGSIMSAGAWLGVASTYTGGLANFMENTGQEMSMLVGNLVALLGGGFLTVFVSFLEKGNTEPESSAEIWETTRDIDNPLSPWMDKYRESFPSAFFKQWCTRPSLSEIQRTFKTARILSYVFPICFTIAVVVIWPSIMISMNIMNFQEFYGWVKLTEVWAFVAAILLIVYPFCNEVWDIWQKISRTEKNPKRMSRIQALVLSASKEGVEKKEVAPCPSPSEVPPSVLPGSSQWGNETSFTFQARSSMRYPSSTRNMTVTWDLKPEHQ